jgi:hypothetical protein
VAVRQHLGLADLGVPAGGGVGAVREPLDAQLELLAGRPVDAPEVLAAQPDPAEVRSQVHDLDDASGAEQPVGGEVGHLL